MSTHRKTATAAFFFCSLATAALPLAAETVYRCGNAYADRPCPQAALVDVDDPRSAAQQANARDVAAREAALASRMAADRERAERTQKVSPVKTAAKTKMPAAAASARVPTPQRSRSRFHQDNGQGDFVAFVPKPPKK